MEKNPSFGFATCLFCFVLFPGGCIRLSETFCIHIRYKIAELLALSGCILCLKAWSLFNVEHRGPAFADAAMNSTCCITWT